MNNHKLYNKQSTVMKNFLLLLLSLNFVNVFAQKPPLDSNAICHWPSLGNCLKISNDGNYFLYNINNQPIGSNTLLIQSTDNLWRKEFINIGNGFLSGDSKKAIFKNGDTLFFLTLGTNLQSYVTNVNAFAWPRYGNGDWIAYQLKNELVLYNFQSNKEQRFSNVIGYSFDDRGNNIIVNTEIERDSIHTNTLQLVDLLNWKVNDVWSSIGTLSQISTLKKYVFDADGNQIAFTITENKSSGVTNSIWYFKKGMPNAIMKVFDHGSTWSIKIDALEFSKSGASILYTLQQNENHKLKEKVRVDVWHYNDQMPFAQKDADQQVQIACAYSVESGCIIPLTEKNERIVSDSKSNYLVVTGSHQFSSLWWSTYTDSFYLLSLIDGSKKFITTAQNTNLTCSFSPHGRYLIYFDEKTRKYFSYDILKNKAQNISKDIPTALDDDLNRVEANLSVPVGIAAWVENESALLIYDNYDIWLIDPLGKMHSRNVTNSYGRLHNIKLRLIDEPELTGKEVKETETLILTALDLGNKNNGFYRKVLNENVDPELLIMGPYNMYINLRQMPNLVNGFSSKKPLKARDVNSWIVQRMTASEAPNYYFTRDFKTYTVLTSLQPQKNYNWLTSELITWTQLDGSTSQGILYKPEDFNPNKKYPIIFNYYEKLSFTLNNYFKPEFTQSNINIPWFVSRGYLVFRPDIHFSIANISGKIDGEHAYNSVVSAALFFSKKPWINKRKLGLNGHSFGGKQTIYLITHSKVFAAAAEAAGVSDEISSYLDGSDRQYNAELGQGRLGVPLWLRPDLYLKKTSVLKANQITTPLLIMHNKADNFVPWNQGVELFMALRRLGKKVWMLQYDEGDHVVIGKDAVDYTIRITQFFDYYLKDLVPPKWMTQATQAQKEIETQYELDYSGRQP
jgi:dipeptidyl aminopeptidase/acylaminoacyl peptidase